MPRKPKPGYFVRGQFVAAGSELDAEFKRELKGTDGVSKTERKRESAERQQLGENMLTLAPARLATLDLDEKLLEALAEARHITDFEGKRRQMQFIGKRMRKLDEGTVEAIRAIIAEQGQGPAAETLLLHRAEAWRERLLAEESAMGDWIETCAKAGAESNAQQLRALVRQARKELLPDAQRGVAPRQGKAYREIFQWLRAHLTAQGSQSEIADAPAADLDLDGGPQRR
ncbi:MAG: ribosome biogenesis factor YjgA [Variovorax sp.]